MSDYESIMYDLAVDECSELDYQQYQADLQEQAEATLTEVLQALDVDDLLANQVIREPYGDGLHAVVSLLTDAVQKGIAKISHQRADSLEKANKKIKRIAREKWGPRIEKAYELKQGNPKLSDKRIAERVIKNEIENDFITIEADKDYLQDTVVNTLRRKLGKDPEFKAIK